jgi:hypothetical protein
MALPKAGAAAGAAAENAELQFRAEQKFRTEATEFIEHEHKRL